MKKSLLLATAVLCCALSSYAQITKPTNLISPVGSIGIGTLDPKQSLDIKSGTIRIQNYAKTPAGDVDANISGRIAVFNALGDVVAGPECLGCIGTPIPTLGFWDINGNDSVRYGTHFLGTKNNQYLDIRSDNSTRLLLTTGTNPSAIFKVPVQGTSVTLNGLFTGTQMNLTGDLIGKKAFFADMVTIDNALSAKGLTVTGDINSFSGTIKGNSSQNASKYFSIQGNTASNDGSSIEMYDKDHPDRSGNLVFSSYAKASGKGNVVFNAYDPSAAAWKQTAMITADGIIYAHGVKVKIGTFPDYVFDKNYKLLSLNELEIYIAKNNHLPGIPSAQEVTANEGVELAEMNRLLLEKVEEQTLYILQLQKRVEAIEAKLLKN